MSGWPRIRCSFTDRPRRVGVGRCGVVGVAGSFRPRQRARNAADCSRSTADWASNGSAIMVSISGGSRFEVMIVEA